MIRAIVLLALAQSPADLDAALDAMTKVPPGDAAAYAAARDRVLAFGKEAIPALAERGAVERWTPDGWVRALAAEACRIRLADPDFAAAVDRPSGLDPERYLQFRRPEPACLPELVRRGSSAVPLLLERWRWTFDAVPFSPGEAGDKERETLRHAILSVPGILGDVRARHFLADVLSSGALADAWRQEAAVSLGMTGGTAALPVLTRYLDDRSGSPAVREACARAIGRIPDLAALDAIRARLDEKDEQVRRSLLHGLGFLGSSWGWDARGPAMAATAAMVRRGCAETLVESLRRFPAEQEAIGRSLAMTAWPDSVKAVEALAADASVSEEVREAARSVLLGLQRAVERRNSTKR